MLTICFEFGDSFSAGSDREIDHATLSLALGMLLRRNVIWLQRHPNAPGFYESGVTYNANLIDSRVPWLDIPAMLSRPVEERGAVCRDIMAYRVAELNVRRRIPVRLAFTFDVNRARNEWTYHVIGAYPTGHLEDASVVAGMPPRRYGQIYLVNTSLERAA